MPGLSLNETHIILGWILSILLNDYSELFIINRSIMRVINTIYYNIHYNSYNNNNNNNNNNIYYINSNTESNKYYLL